MPDPLAVGPPPRAWRSARSDMKPASNAKGRVLPGLPAGSQRNRRLSSPRARAGVVRLPPLPLPLPLSSPFAAVAAAVAAADAVATAGLSRCPPSRPRPPPGPDCSGEEAAAAAAASPLPSRGRFLLSGPLLLPLPATARGIKGGLSSPSSFAAPAAASCLGGCGDPAAPGVPLPAATEAGGGPFDSVTGISVDPASAPTGGAEAIVDPPRPPALPVAAAAAHTTAEGPSGSSHGTRNWERTRRCSRCTFASMHARQTHGVRRCSPTCSIPFPKSLPSLLPLPPPPPLARALGAVSEGTATPGGRY
ncbi:unnamed protein product [Ectocarpus sp. 12 AP-2014]